VAVLLSLLWLLIVTWLILRAVRQGSLLPHLNPAPPLSPGEAPQVTVIVPARDEEANIGRCLSSIVALDYPGARLSVLVVDDHSADATAAIVRKFAAQYRQVSLTQSPPLPPRWIGKSHACWIGARSVAPECQWLCFIDADVTVTPRALSSAIHAALTEHLDLLSLAPRHELRSFAERLILPCGLVMVAFTQDLRQAQGLSRNEVTAAGQFMLVRRDAYETVGGHAAVCTMICEDLEIARRLKQSGRSVLLMGGQEFVSTRMYTGWRTLWPGLAKNLVDTFGGPVATLSLAVAGVILAWAAFAIPALDFAAWRAGVQGALIPLLVALAGSGAAVGLHVAAASYFRIPLWYGLIFPLGYTVGAVMAIDSVRRRLRGRVSWKGRIYS